jgi:hypothetical protein
LSSDPQAEPRPASAPNAPDTPEPPDSPDPQPRVRTALPRAWGAVRRFTAPMERRPVLLSVVLAVCAAALPLGFTAWGKFFPDDSVKLQIQQLDEPCDSDWLIHDDSPGFERSLQNGDKRQFARWAREGRIEHRGFVAALVTLRGNMDKPVRITDLTVTVTSRTAPLTGIRAPNTRGCGGDGDPPEAIGINLDAMAVGREVPVRRLQLSPHQKEAAAAVKSFGDPVQLPRTVTSDDYYSLYLVGVTKSSSVSWQAHLTWWDGEKTWRTTLDNDGRPFRVTANPS